MNRTVRVSIRNVHAEAKFWLERGSKYPHCRNKHNTILESRPWWNVRTDIAHGDRDDLFHHGGSNYWCNAHLPARYRRVADSMLRGGEKTRVLTGGKLLDVALPMRKNWRNSTPDRAAGAAELNAVGQKVASGEMSLADVDRQIDTKAQESATRVASQVKMRDSYAMRVPRFF